MRRVRDLFSNIEDRTLSWLRALLLVMLAAWGAVKSGLSTGFAQSPWLEVGAAAVELGWRAAIGLFGLSQKPIYTLATETPQVLPAAEKYARSALPETRQVEIASRLEQGTRPVTTLDTALAQPAEITSLVAVEASGPDCCGIRR